jgi:hypothetical protein
MKRDHDDSASPPPKKSRKSEPKRDPRRDSGDEADKTDEPPQHKTDGEKNPYWEVSEHTQTPPVKVCSANKPPRRKPMADVRVRDSCPRSAALRFRSSRA